MASESIRYPGFDSLRIFAAAAVVFSHSFLIAEGTEDNAPGQMLTGEIFGVYAVLIFFVLSGFLVTDSAIRTGDLKSFASKRLRRILPGYVVVNVVTMVVVAALFTTSGTWTFLRDPDAWATLGRVLSFQETSLYFTEQVSFYPPMSQEAAYLGGVANGVLWTIRLELSLYVLVGVLLVAETLRRNPVVIIAVLSVVFAFAYGMQVNDYLQQLPFVMPSFMAGMLLRMMGHTHRADGWVAAGSGLILVALALEMPGWVAVEVVLFPIFAAYPLLWIGQKELPGFAHVRRWGDPSYGMYLWGWPIQQVVRHWMGAGHSGWEMAAVCLPLVVLAGYLSWHLVERPFLRRRVKAPPDAGNLQTAPQ